MPSDLRIFVEKYAESDSLSQMVILSLVDHKKYTKNNIMKYFPGSTKHQVDKARKYQRETFVLPAKTKHKRNKLDIRKCEHFLDFIFNSGLLQDVAYGVTNIKFYCGEEQKIAHAILTTKYSHAISFYYQMCSESGYDPLSKSTLFNILKALKPSQRKSLAGLDDIQAAAMNGFDYLLKAVKELSDDKRLSIMLEQGKRYLKTRYQRDCRTDAMLSTHNQKFALSDEKEELREIHNIDLINGQVSSYIYELFYAMDSIREKAEKGGEDDKIYDVKNSIDNIISYIKHQVRDSQQSKAKSSAFQSLDSNTGLWLKDYAQKVLPDKHREGQKDYFGKKGMTVHIDVLFVKRLTTIIKHVYYTVVYRCDQNMEDTFCISENVLKEIKKDVPEIDTLFIKSDNAGCYHGNYSAEINHLICKRENIKLLMYDFNEPSKGKDQCDREAASAKSLLRAYIEAGNDIQSAEDIYNAMHYANGLRHSKVCVAEIDTEKTIVKCKTTKNVSHFHSVSYEKTGMKMRRYFEIGDGIMQEYSDCDFQSGLIVRKPFHSTENIASITDIPTSTPKRGREDRQLCTLYFCPENGCKCSFNEKREYEVHLLEGIHEIIKDHGSMDTVKKNFVSKMKAITQSTRDIYSSEAHIADIDLTSACKEIPLMSVFSRPGWALPIRNTFRYSYEQKIFLYNVFKEGEETGKKMSPEQVHMKMRKQFSANQYVTVQQIKSLFSRWSSEQRKGYLKNQNTHKQKNVLHLSKKKL